MEEKELQWRENERIVSFLFFGYIERKNKNKESIEFT